MVSDYPQSLHQSNFKKISAQKFLKNYSSFNNFNVFFKKSLFRFPVIAKRCAGDDVITILPSFVAIDTVILQI